MNRRIMSVIIGVLLLSVILTLSVSAFTRPSSVVITMTAPWTPSPIAPTYNSADLSPTAVYIPPITPTFTNADQSATAPPPQFYGSLTPSAPAPYPTLTLPVGSPTATRVGHVTIALQANPAYSRIITDDDMRMATDIIRARLRDYYVGDLNIVTIDDIIYLEFADNGNMLNILEAIQQQGTLEIVDLSAFTLEFRRNLIGSTIYTTGYQRAYPLDDGLVNPYTNDAFETIVAVEYPTRTNVYGRDGAWTVDLTLNYDDAEQLLRYTQAHIGTLMGIVLDGQLITMPLIERPSIDIALINDFEPFTADEAQRIANMLRHGTLPFPMEVVEYNIVD